MKKNVRELVFEPLVGNSFRCVVPDFQLTTKAGEIIASPAEIFYERGNFNFRVFDDRYQNDAIGQIFGIEEPPSGGYIISKGEGISIKGTLAGEVPFESTDVFPTGRGHYRRPGVCSIDLRAFKLDLASEANRRSQQELTCGKVSAVCNGHVIFHGPKLGIRDGVSKITHTNEYLGEWYSQSLDTHQFEGDVWKAALIQKDEELHLHFGLKKELQNHEIPDHPKEILEAVIDSVAFTHGFNPWPCYYSFWSPAFGREEWLRPKFRLNQSPFRAVQGALFYHPSVNASGPYEVIIPKVAEGLQGLAAKSRERLKFLLWNVTEVCSGQLPASTQMLMLCSAIDGLLRIAAGMEEGDVNTKKLWETASDRLGLEWNGWIREIYQLRPQHRGALAHGRLWHMKEVGNETYFNEYPKLAHAFSVLYARLCGYERSVVDEKHDEIVIRDLMAEQNQAPDKA